VIAPWRMKQEETPFICRKLDSLPMRPVAIVFGSYVFPNGRMSDMLAERVATGAMLYKVGKARRLLLTGEDRAPRYDEVTPMARFAVALGVPVSAIETDGRGYRTLDSCYRARSVFRIRSAILVTQDFHLPRALFLAREMGIDAIGYPAPPDKDSFRMARDCLRERFATLFAYSDAFMRRRSGFP